MDSRKRLNETLLSNKGDFYSNLNMEDITNADYKYATKYGKNLK